MSENVTGPAGTPTVPPAPGSGAVPPAAGPAPTKKTSPARAALNVVVLVVVFGVIGGLLWFGTKDQGEQAEVGDCVAQSSSDEDSISRVGCTDPKAAFKVVGRLEDRKQPLTSLDTQCDAFPSATSNWWKGETGGTGVLLCLEKLGK